MFSLSNRKCSLCQFTYFVTITYTKLPWTYPGTGKKWKFSLQIAQYPIPLASGNLQLEKTKFPVFRQNSLCFDKISKFPVFSLTENIFGYFPCFPCAVGTYCRVRVMNDLPRVPLPYTRHTGLVQISQLVKHLYPTEHTTQIPSSGSPLKFYYQITCFSNCKLLIFPLPITAIHDCFICKTDLAETFSFLGKKMGIICTKYRNIFEVQNLGI